VWAALIFFLSSQPGEAFPEITFVPNADKAVHVLEYAVLALLLARALFQYMGRTHRAPASIVCLIVCFAFAVLDEFHQVSVPNRSFEWGDLGADTVGIGVGVLVYVLIQLRIAKRKTPSPEET
jgi:VanZ family protein